MRQQRILPLLVGILSGLLGIGLLVLAQAPRELVALVAAMAVGLGSSLLLTLVWKISIHVAVVAGAVLIVALVFGPVAVGLVPLVLLVGRARVALQDHMPARRSRAPPWVRWSRLRSSPFFVRSDRGPHDGSAVTGGV